MAWAPGDLALCVREGMIICPVCGSRCEGRTSLRVGQVAEVSSIAACGDYGKYCVAPVLLFSGGRAGHSYRFRKIAPHAPDAEDYVTIALLNGQSVPVDA